MLIVTSKDFSGWILGGIATDCFLTNSKKNSLIFLERNFLVYLKLYFLIFCNRDLVFINHHVLLNLKFPKILLRLKRYNVLYTHSSISLEHNKLRLLGLANRIVVLNKAEKNNLIKFGIEAENIKICFIGVDRSKFKRENLKIKNEKSVILVSQYHPRKNLETLNQLVQDFSDWAFTLVGAGWESSGILANLCSNKNFTYVKFDKETYPDLLGSNRFFLSLSNIEGGPIPLIESMETGLIPLVTRTGWSVDLLDPLYSYHLLNIPVDIKEVKSKLIKLSASDSINFDTVLKNISYDGFIRDLVQF